MEFTVFSLFSCILLAGYIVLVGYAGVEVIKRFIASSKSTTETEDPEDPEEQIE